MTIASEEYLQIPQMKAFQSHDLKPTSELSISCFRGLSAISLISAHFSPSPGATLGEVKQRVLNRHWLEDMFSQDSHWKSRIDWSSFLMMSSSSRSSPALITASLVPRALKNCSLESQSSSVTTHHGLKNGGFDILEATVSSEHPHLLHGLEPFLPSPHLSRVWLLPHPEEQDSLFRQAQRLGWHWQLFKWHWHCL